MPSDLARELREEAADYERSKFHAELLIRAADALDSKLAAEREALAEELCVLDALKTVPSDSSATMNIRRTLAHFPDWNTPAQALWLQQADRLLASGVIHEAKPLPTREEVVALMRKHFNIAEDYAVEVAENVLALLRGEGRWRK